MPISNKRLLNRIKMALEKIIAGNMYLISIIKTIVFLRNKNIVNPAKANKINKYQKFWNSMLFKFLQSYTQITVFKTNYWVIKSVVTLLLGIKNWFLKSTSFCLKRFLFSEVSYNVSFRFFGRIVSEILLGRYFSTHKNSFDIVSP